MKQSIFYLLLLLVSTMSTAPSCKKTNTEEQLPPETHEGKFTFGCKVDGKVYTARGQGGLLSSEHVYYILGSSDSSINIFAGNTNSKFSLELTIKYTGGIGTYLR